MAVGKSRAARSTPPPAAARPRSRPRSTLVLALYTLLSLFYTWPLAARLTTHMPGDGGDDPALAWNLWWIKHRLIDQVNLDFFHVDYMFYPIEINLAFYTLTPLNGLLSVPLQTGLNLLVANNLVLLSSFVLGGYGTYLLLLWLFNRFPLSAPAVNAQGSAILGGIFYAFASSKLFYPALGQFNIASSHWVPFCALYLLQTVYARTLAHRLRAAGLAGLFWVFQAWAELTYASFLLIFGLLVFGYWLVRILASRRAGSGLAAGLRVWLTAGALFGGVFVVGISPFLAAMVPDLRVEGDFFGMGGGFADTFSADLMGYFFPTMLHPWWGEWIRGLPFPNDKGQQVYVGYTLTVLLCAGAVGLWRARHTRPHTFWLGGLWMVAAVLFFLLTLGPHLRWAGQDLPIPGPFALVSQLPFFSGNRYPSRYSIMLMLAIAPLAGYGLLWLQSRLQARLRSLRTHTAGYLMVAVALLFSLEHLSAPLPMTHASVPPIYRTLAAIPGDFAVLELPTGWRNGARIVGRADELIMFQQWYQTEHAKRRLGGNTSRNPQYKFQYFSNIPVLADLIALMNADRDHLAAPLEADRNALIARHRPSAGPVLHQLGVRYVLLHTEPQRAPPALQQFVEATLPLTLVEEWTGPDWTGQPAGIRLYALELDAATDAPTTVDLTGSEANHHMAEGWNAPAAGTIPARLAHRSQVDLLLPVQTATGSPITAYTLTLDRRLPLPPQLTLRWNGRVLTSWEQEDAHLRITPPPIPPNQTTVARLTLEFGPVPLDLAAIPTPATTPIGTTGTSLPGDIHIVARSAGEEVGDFAQILVNGVDHAPNQIGYNLVALDPAGTVLDAAAFDTHGNPQAGAQLAAWIEQWPAGTIVAAAVADEAALSLDEGAVAALARLGSQEDLRGRFRTSHALIGVVGAPPGSAVEATALRAPAAVGIGWPVDAPTLYGGIERLSWQ